MVSSGWYSLLILVVAAERLVELSLSKRNARWSFARGGREFGKEHFRAMFALHTGLLLTCLLEVWLGKRPFHAALAWPMLACVISAQGLRWWVIATLGPMWNTRVIVVPGLQRVEGGPFRLLRHPNYAAVVIEGLALPLAHSAYVTALTFTLLNAALLGVRIRCEEKALALLKPSKAESRGAPPCR